MILDPPSMSKTHASSGETSREDEAEGSCWTEDGAIYGLRTSP